MADFQSYSIGTGGVTALSDSKPAAWSPNILVDGDGTTGGVGRFWDLKNASTIVSTMTKAGALAVAGLISIGSASFASSSPGLKASSTTLQVRLADDSALTTLEAKGVTITGGTVTASAPPLSITQTWNNSGVTFNAITLDVTVTSAAAASRLLKFSIGGTARYQVGYGNAGTDLLINGTSDDGSYGVGLTVGGLPSGIILTREGFIVRRSSGSNVMAFTGSAGNDGLSIHESYSLTWASTGGALGTKDVGLWRKAAGVIEINSGTQGTFRDLYLRNLRLAPVTVTNLVAASTVGQGALAFVTDATAVTARSTVAGGGSNKVLVMSDGTNWLIVA